MKKVKKQTPAEKEAYLKKLNSEFAKMAQKVIAGIAPNKCFIIIQDQFGNGTSQASNDFTMEELMQYLNAIMKKNNTNV